MSADPRPGAVEAQPRWRLRSLAPADAAAAARIHAEGQPGTFLTSLGARFLCALYDLMAAAPECYGYVAEEEGELVGVAVGTVNARVVFRRLIGRWGLRLALPVLGAMVMRPSLVGQVIQTLRYANHVGAQPGEAELFFIGVRADRRGQGIGRALFGALAQAFWDRGLQAMGLTVDDSNETAKRFYQRNGMKPVSCFTLYGRRMCWYSLALEGRGPSASEVVGEFTSARR
ncbi:MAG: GNAT family N-acetyltransferase [Chloroflexi bacterium]|nr:GNAT family N-acetyltransferase [Chloroflexota bacterium]